MGGIYELDERLGTMEFYDEKSLFTAVNSKTSLNHSRWFRNLIWAWSLPRQTITVRSSLYESHP